VRAVAYDTVHKLLCDADLVSSVLDDNNKYAADWATYLELAVTCREGKTHTGIDGAVRFWREFQPLFPTLQPLALAVIHVSPVVTACDSFLSMVGGVINDQRSMSSIALMQVMLKANTTNYEALFFDRPQYFCDTRTRKQRQDDAEDFPEPLFVEAARRVSAGQRSQQSPASVSPAPRWSGGAAAAAASSPARMCAFTQLPED
jgi:hypothetical protein